MGIVKKWFKSLLPFFLLVVAFFGMSFFKHEDVLQPDERAVIDTFFGNQQQAQRK